MLFSRRHFSQWMQLWLFKLVRMIAHGRFEGNLRLQVPGKVVGESGRSITVNTRGLGGRHSIKYKWSDNKLTLAWDEHTQCIHPSFGYSVKNILNTNDLLLLYVRHYLWEDKLLEISCSSTTVSTDISEAKGKGNIWIFIMSNMRNMRNRLHSLAESPNKSCDFQILGVHTFDVILKASGTSKFYIMTPKTTITYRYYSVHIRSQKYISKYLISCKICIF